MYSWKTSTSYFWEEAPFFRLLLPLIAVILFYEYHFLPHWSFSTIFGLLIFIILIRISLSYLKNFPPVFSLLRTIVIYASLFVLGWLICFSFDIQNNPSWFGHKLDTSNFFVAKVIATPAEKEKTWKLEVSIDKAIQGKKSLTTNGKAFVYVYKNDRLFDIHEGDKLLLPNKWIRIKNSGNPFEFDYSKFAKRENIFYQEFLSKQEIVKIAAPQENRSIIDRWHNWSMNTLAHYVKDKSSIGLLQAMLLGDKINFDREQRQLYVATGIIHIVAISGGHIAFLFMIITFCFFWIKNKKYKWVKYLVAVPLIWIYVFIAGAPPSAIRAAIMFSLIGLGFIFQKNSNPINQLFAAAFIILLSKPLWLFAVGFQLSFLAVLSILVFYKKIQKIWLPENLILRKLWSAVAISVSVEILVAPLVIFYFHIFPVAFIFSNIIAWLIMGIIMSAGILILCFSSIPFIASFIARLVAMIVAIFNQSLSILQLLNPPSFKLFYLSLSQLFLVYIIIIGLAIFIVQKNKPSLFAGLFALLILLVSFGHQRWIYLQQRKFIAYNINQSDYTELIEGNKYITILDDSLLNEQTMTSASKEMHIYSRSLQQTKKGQQHLIRIGKEYLLILKKPVNLDSEMSDSVDYLMIDYPLIKFTGKQLKHIFHFKKLIISGNHKRYIVERWKDSCDKYHIDAHFTLLDGAFILSE